MAFYVYTNWRAGYYRRIHQGKCRHCNNGHGKRLDKKEGRNGEWSPALKTYKEASSYKINREKAYELTDCKDCNPK